MEKHPFDDRQYLILQERIWKYNDLLWKNFLAYGGALVILVKLSADAQPGTVLSRGVIQLVGCLLLGILALIQCALLTALRRHARDANAYETERKIRIITLGPEDVRALKQISVQDAYTLAVAGMFAVPVVAFIILVTSLGRCCGH